MSKKKESRASQRSRRAAGKAFAKATKKLRTRKGASEILLTGQQQFSAFTPAKRARAKRRFKALTDPARIRKG